MFSLNPVSSERACRCRSSLSLSVFADSAARRPEIIGSIETARRHKDIRLLKFCEFLTAPSRYPYKLVRESMLRVDSEPRSGWRVSKDWPASRGVVRFTETRLSE